MKLSIVVPVYNVEAFLDECLESITSQIDSENRDVEVILVDDGSKDNSGCMCDNWSERFPYIRTIHKPNGGLSSARNAGLDVAAGEYILFVDSDDRIATGSIKVIIEGILASRVDLYFLSGIKFYPSGKQEKLDSHMDRELVYQRESTEVIKYVSNMTRYPGSACTKAYRRNFLNENNLRFPLDRRTAEDLGFTLRCLLSAKTFDVIECEYYEYRQNREGSITNNSVDASKAFWNVMIFLHESIELLAKNGEPKTMKARYALSLVAYEYSVALINFCNVTERRTEAEALMKDLKWLCNYLTSKRGRAISLMIDVLGIRITSKVLLYAYRLRKYRMEKNIRLPVAAVGGVM